MQPYFWDSTLGVIFHINAQARTDITIAMDAYIRRLQVDSSARPWVATSSGLFLLDCQPTTPCVPQSVNGLEKASIRDFAIDTRGTVWATDEQGLYRIEVSGMPRAWKTQAVRIVTPNSFKRFDLIAPDADDSLWVSCGKEGIYRLQIDNKDGVQVARSVEFYPASLLASNQIVSLDVDRTGRLWIGTDHGVNVLQNGTVALINEDSGLIWNDIDSRAFLSDPDGSIWIGTSKGVSHLLDPAALLTRTPFAAMVDIAQYDDKAMPLTTKTLWNGGVTTIYFSGLTFRDNRELRYFYSLIGFDSTSVLTHSPIVRFQKLSPGTYTFRIVAEDPAYGLFSVPATYTFTLTPPWWRTYYFYALLAVVCVFLIVMAWRVSQRALIAQRTKLERLVAERTSELEQLAVHDSLTGLLNRNAILNTLTAEIQKARACNSQICIAIIDLDHFKQINDTYGHLAGDEVLRRSAERLQSAIRSSDSIGRYGGEEFLIIFHNLNQQLGVDRCEHVRKVLCDEPICYGSHQLQITCSVGLAYSITAAALLSDVIAHADRALYLAKENGRNRTESNRCE